MNIKDSMLPFHSERSRGCHKISCTEAFKLVVLYECEGFGQFHKCIVMCNGHTF